jgi:hypothetical protein
MKKLKLMLDELAVETFETVKSRDGRGTVVGRADDSVEMCSLGCPSDFCFTAACVFTVDGCDTNGPGITEVFSCVCPDTERC